MVNQDKVLSIRINGDLIDNFRAVCKKNRKRQGVVIRQLIEQYIADHGEKLPQKRIITPAFNPTPDQMKAIRECTVGDDLEKERRIDKFLEKHKFA